MLDNIKRDAAKVLLTVQIQGVEDIPDEDTADINSHDGFNVHSESVSLLEQPDQTKSVTPPDPRIGRNAPCPCGSGLKYKHCHGKLA